MALNSQALVVVSPSTTTNAAGRKIQTVFTGRDHVRTMVATTCHTDQQKRISELPSHDIEIFENGITEQQIRSARPSYVNALLIQSRGIINNIACNLCRTKENRGPFVDCVSLEGEWKGCCANCKWRDHGAKCGGQSYGLAAVEGSSRVEEVKEVEDDKE